MPSARVLVSPKMVELNQIGALYQMSVSRLIADHIAASFGISVDDVEVLWMPVTFAIGELPISVEVMYSVSEKLNLNSFERDRLATGLSNILILSKYVPAGIDKAGAWILPQHDAVFKTAIRK